MPPATATKPKSQPATALKPATSARVLKKAVIMTGGKQYLVAEGESLEIEMVQPAKSLSFEPLLVIDGEKIAVGAPYVAGVTVTAEVMEQMVKAQKVTAIRYKAKKRVRKVRGHRQRHSLIKISKIS